MEDLIFNAHSKVYCSYGSLNRLKEIVSSFGHRLLIVTEKSLVDSNAFKKIKDEIRKHDLDLITFAEITPNSTTHTIEKASEIARVSRIQAIIGFGGIRALSAAKAVAVAASYTGNFYNIMSETPPELLPIPYIEISGTFRNPFMLSPDFILPDARNGALQIVTVKNAAPAAIIIDPSLFMDISRQYKIATLMDVFLEAVEGFFSIRSNFISDMLFLKTISMIVNLLPSILEDPDNPENLLSAGKAGFSTALGLTISTTGLGTACAAEISKQFGASRAITATILLPYILEYGLRVCPEKVTRMGPILGEDISGLSIISAADRVIESLRLSIGIQNLPVRLSELGIKKENLISVAEQVFKLPMINFLPSKITVEDIYIILKDAL
ncbi:MAG: iron-containing alcohol dehydrogenase [Spirochaetales bacterium]|nr:iron-containing alcohol dehydrogenase [Spirochaetales bacterium]